MNTISNTYKPTEELHIGNGIYKTSLNGLLFIHHKKNKDERGFFAEINRIPELEEACGHEFKIIQINHARSEEHVVRGIHAEDWNKLVFITSGVAFVAIADVRPQSSTFGKKEYFLMGVGEQTLDGGLFLPATIGNSVLALEGPLDYIYCVDRLYKERNPAGDMAISLFDPDLAIEWPVPEDEMIISERDRNSVLLKERFPSKF